MSRGARRTGRRHSQSRGTILLRARRPRPVKITVLIVGDGRTEQNYFDRLKRREDVSNRFAVTVKTGKGKAPERVVKEALQLKNREEDYDERWCVLDVEGPRGAAPGRRASLEEAGRLAGEHNIQLCLSNPSFEIWLLSHFERRAGSFANCDAVIKELNGHWQRVFRQDYQKNDEHVYDRIAENTQAAIDNGKWVRENHHKDINSTIDCNSSTEVYRLVEHLLGA